MITLSLAAAVLNTVLFVGTVGAAALLIDASVLEQNIGHPVGMRDYLTLAWIISSMATVGGAIGSGLEDEEDVRAAAYGYHPRPPETRYGLRTSFSWWSWWSASRSRWRLRLPGQDRRAALPPGVRP